MCAILDSSYFKYIDNPKMGPVYQWLDNYGGKLIHCTHGKYGREVRKYEKALLLMAKYQERGLLKMISKHKIEEHSRVLTRKKWSKLIKSNDLHILTLARASEAPLLIADDRKLIRDFKDIIKGDIYKDQNDQDLLKPDLCP